MSVRRPDRSTSARIVEVTVADDPSAWAAAGFRVDEDQVRVGSLAVRLTGRVDGARGITGWTLAGVLDRGEPDVDGLPTVFAATAPDDAPSTSGSGEPAEHPGHPNGTTGLDHVVVFTPDLERTVAAFEALQLSCRRVREAGTDDAPLRQAFFRLGSQILEVVGPTTGSGETVEEAPARWFGLAVDVADLDATATHLGPALGRTKLAMQRGRRIATLRHRDVGVSVSIAFMDDQADRVPSDPPTRNEEAP